MTAAQWIWQQPNWPDCTVQPKLRALHDRLGQLKGKISLVDSYVEFSLDTLLENTLSSSVITKLTEKAPRSPAASGALFSQSLTLLFC